MTYEEKIKRGRENEKEAQYHINFYFSREKNTYIFNNIKLKYKNRKVQIDHIVIQPNRIFIIESKRIGGTVYINKDGSWVAYYNKNKKYMLKSPIEQNYRHIELFREIAKEIIGIKTLPIIYNIVLFSNTTELKGDISKNVFKNDEVRKIKQFKPNLWFKLMFWKRIKKAELKELSLYLKSKSSN